MATCSAFKALRRPSSQAGATKAVKDTWAVVLHYKTHTAKDTGESVTGREVRRQRGASPHSYKKSTAAMESVTCDATCHGLFMSLSRGNHHEYNLR